MRNTVKQHWDYMLDKRYYELVEVEEPVPNDDELPVKDRQYWGNVYIKRKALGEYEEDEEIRIGYCVKWDDYNEDWSSDIGKEIYDVMKRNHYISFELVDYLDKFMRTR